MREIVMQTTGLTKRYRDLTALDHADMTVYKKDIYGLIGRNGAGKTTIMKVITGLTESSGGEFRLFGKSGSDADSEKKRIGCLIENPAFFGSMTAYQNLKYYALQKGITDEMKQRLGIALAVMDNPDLVILDEPINGLDPIGISELRETFRKMSSERGVTFIISSHILSELYMVANRFLFIDKGKILKEITKEELDLECMRCHVVKTDDTKNAAVIIEKDLGITNYKVIDSGEIRIYDENIRPDEINKLLVRNNVNVSGIYETGISLEDYFKSLVGEERS